MKRWFRRIAEALASLLCRVVGCVPVEEGEYKALAAAGRELTGFCGRSGFLRDGRHSGGRHAERKIRAIAQRLAGTSLV